MGLTAVQRANARLVNFRVMGNVSTLVPAHANQNLTARVSLLYDFLTRFRAVYITRADTPALSTTTSVHMAGCTMEGEGTAGEDPDGQPTVATEAHATTVGKP